MTYLVSDISIFVFVDRLLFFFVTYILFCSISHLNIKHIKIFQFFFFKLCNFFTIFCFLSLLVLVQTILDIFQYCNKWNYLYVCFLTEITHISNNRCLQVSMCFPSYCWCLYSCFFLSGYYILMQFHLYIFRIQLLST